MDGYSREPPTAVFAANSDFLFFFPNWDRSIPVFVSSNCFLRARINSTYKQKWTFLFDNFFVMKTSLSFTISPQTAVRGSSLTETANSKVRCYWTQIQIIKWKWVAAHPPLPYQTRAPAAHLYNLTNVSYLHRSPVGRHVSLFNLCP